MYLKKVNLEHIGPIDRFNFELPFHENGNPKPIILVGENGTGKSILLSFIVNSLISAKQLFFENAEVENNKVYKIRSSDYIKSGQEYYFAKLIFERDFQYIEWQLSRTKKAFEENLIYCPNNEDWNKIPDLESNVIWANFNEQRENLQEILSKNCLLYFPPNRFEEPAWLNLSNLRLKPEYSNIENITGLSNRSIFNYAPLKSNQNWLLDILLDRELYEKNLALMPQLNNVNEPKVPINAFFGHKGQCSTIYNLILEVLKIVMQTEANLTLGFGNRLSRKVSIIRNGKQWIPNIFQMSTGQTLVLNLFLTILRDFDLSNTYFESLSDVRGIVLIDEIDLHLHSNLQYQVLPTLIKLFPKVQFIITSHSPLFILGLKQKLTEEGFSIYEMPNGQKISTETFREFEEAYTYFKATNSYIKDIQKEIYTSHKPLIYVEGDYDIRYLEKAADVLQKKNVLSNFLLKNANGYGNLDKIWNSLKTACLAEILPQIIILFYDCDTNKQNENRGKVFKKVIEFHPDTPIEIGIENLFSLKTIEKAQAYNSAFIDFTQETRKTVRGKEVIVPEKKEVNRDEKGKLCTWLCDTGTQEDFVNFEFIFNYLEQVLINNQE